MRLLLSYSPPPSSSNSINSNNNNSTILFARNIIIVIAIMFFVCGLLHLLVRYLMKRKRLLSLSTNAHFQSSRFQENEGESDAYDRQLQNLFNLHDSGLDQAFIDALPVFSYKELMGLKEPFDCAVCLCEFTQQDNLRLLPLCSHAFHMHCIDTWLLSNSSCPLCRGTLFSPGFSVDNPVFEFNVLREEDVEQGHFSHFKQTNVEQGHFSHFKQSEGGILSNERRVYPVRLGKFRATNVVKKEEKEVGETSNSNFDARRCYSMGSYEYIVGNSDLKVAFVPNNKVTNSKRRGSFGTKDYVVDKEKGNSSSSDHDGKKISNRSKGESFSVSKIWLWSKKDVHKGQVSSGTHMVNSSVNVSLPFTNANTSHS